MNYYQSVVDKIMKRYPDKELRDYVSGVIVRKRNGFNEIYIYNFTEFIENLNDFIKDGKSAWSEKELHDQCEKFIESESHCIVLRA